MANKKIYILDDRDTLSDSDNIPLDFTGNTGEAKKTSIAALKAKIAPANSFGTLTDGPTTTWNRNSINIAKWTPAGDHLLAITGLTGPDSGQIYIYQDPTGARVPVLPGNVETGSKFSASPGDYDICGFLYDGTDFSWVITNFGNTSASLGKPSLSVTQSGTAANLVSSSVTNATGYKFERSTDPTFASGVTTIQDSSLNTATDSGPLTVGTTYYYRVTAHASGFINSVSTIKSLNPISGEFIEWTGLLNATTTSGTGDLVYTSGSTCGAVATKKLAKADGNYIQAIVGASTPDTDRAVLCLKTSNDAHYDWSAGMTFKVAVYPNMSNFYSSINDNTITPDNLGSLNAGDIYRIEIANTDDLLIKVSTDGGTTFTTKHTYTGALSGVTDLYPAGLIAVPSVSGVKLHAANGSGLI